jgi:hypothetical protein
LVGNISGYIRCICAASAFLGRTVVGYNLFLSSGTKDCLKEFAAKEKLEIVKVQDFGSEFLARPSPAAGGEMRPNYFKNSPPDRKL